LQKRWEKRVIKVFEVYPHATRYILKIAPKSKKLKKIGKQKIIEKLKKFVTAVEWDYNHNEIDAIIAALTVYLYYRGKGRILSGSDDSLLHRKYIENFSTILCSKFFVSRFLVFSFIYYLGYKNITRWLNL